MRLLAFILSRPRDTPLVELLAAELVRHGWSPHAILDPIEWPGGLPDMVGHAAVIAGNYAATHRMTGIPCACGIADALLNHARNGDVVAKFDCDTRLLPEGYRWFAGADRFARCYALTNLLWGGCWAAPMWQVLAARSVFNRIKPCDCPESNLFVQAFRSNGGLAVERVRQARYWRMGESWPDGAGAATLLAGARLRVERARELFSIDLVESEGMVTP